MLFGEAGLGWAVCLNECDAPHCIVPLQCTDTLWAVCELSLMPLSPDSGFSRPAFGGQEGKYSVTVPFRQVV